MIRLENRVSQLEASKSNPRGDAPPKAGPTLDFSAHPSHGGRQQLRRVCSARLRGRNRRNDRFARVYARQHYHLLQAARIRCGGGLAVESCSESRWWSIRSWRIASRDWMKLMSLISTCWSCFSNRWGIAMRHCMTWFWKTSISWRIRALVHKFLYPSFFAFVLNTIFLFREWNPPSTSM